MCDCVFVDLWRSIDDRDWPLIGLCSQAHGHFGDVSWLCGGRMYKTPQAKSRVKNVKGKQIFKLRRNRRQAVLPGLGGPRKPPFSEAGCGKTLRGPPQGPAKCKTPALPRPPWRRRRETVCIPRRSARENPPATQRPSPQASLGRPELAWGAPELALGRPKLAWDAPKLARGARS